MDRARRPSSSSARPSSRRPSWTSPGYRPLAEARAVPQQDLDNALAAEQVAVAGVGRRRRPRSRTPSSNQRISIQQAQAAVEAAEGRRDPGRAEPRLHDGRAPVSGIIGRLEVDEGNLVGKGEPTLLATMSTVDPIYAISRRRARWTTCGFARRVRRGAAGPPASACAARAVPGRRHASTRTRVGSLRRPGGRPQDRDHRRRRPQFPNPERVLRPGQFGRVRGVVEERADAILVPQRRRPGAAGGQDGAGGGARATRSRSGRVTLDERIGDSYIVTRGLKARRARDRRGPPEGAARDAGEARGGPAGRDAARRWRGAPGRPTASAGRGRPRRDLRRSPAAKPQGGG